MDMKTTTVMEKETDMETETDNTQTHTWTGIVQLLLNIQYGTIVPIAPYGSPLTYHGTISNSTIYILLVPFHDEK
jgi:hypothetical protein